jgi:hypothetical protein
MSNSLPRDLQGLRVIFRGNIDDQGLVTSDWRGENVRVKFDDGKEEYVPRTDVEVVDDDD